LAKKPDINMGRLGAAMTKARLSLRRFRETRREMVREWCGLHWGVDGTHADKRVPLNMMSLYTRIVGRSLIAANPRVMLSTFAREAKPIVSAMEAWINTEIERMNLAKTLGRIVLDGLFSIGIGKVALATPADSSIAGWQTPTGAPFCERVSLDDFVYDVHARSFEEVGYIGHRYRAPLDVIRADHNFSKARKDLSPQPDNQFNLEGDERLSVIGRGYYSNDEEFEDFVDLWEIYIPRRRTICTFAYDYGSGSIDTDQKPLKEVEWIGPDSGPYIIYSLGDVPDNAMPKSPMMDLYDLHLAQNQLIRKLLRQGERQKDLTLYAEGDEEDAKAIRDAGDGDMIGVKHPDKIFPYQSSNVNQGNLGLNEMVKQWTSYMAGNLEMMGGLSPQSKTATQDKMLHENASMTLADMQERTVTYTSKLVNNLCWFWHHHPVTTMKSLWHPPGLPEHAIQRILKPADRQKVPWADLGILINPYSLQHQTPQAQLTAINNVVQNIVTPLMPLLQQQGIYFDLAKYLAIVAKYGNLTELPDILTIGTPPSPDGNAAGPQSTPSTLPAQTSRETTRRSLGGDTNEARSAAIQNQALAGGKAGGHPSANGFAKMGASNGPA
jgi:hypothetical protein